MTVSSDQRSGIEVATKSSSWPGDIVRDDEIEAFRREFRSGVGQQIMSFRRKADHQLSGALA